MTKHPFIQQWLQRDHAPHRPDHKTTEHKNSKEFQNNSRGKDVENILKQIENYQLDLTCTYSDWVDIGFSFASEFGEAGRSYYHRVSRFHPRYDLKECDVQYDRCLKGKKTGTTIRSFFYVAKMAGIEIKNTVKQ